MSKKELQDLLTMPLRPKILVPLPKSNTFEPPPLPRHPVSLPSPSVPSPTYKTLTFLKNKNKKQWYGKDLKESMKDSNFALGYVDGMY